MQYYGHKISKTARVFSKKLNNVLSPMGLYSSQWGILMCLHYRSTLTQVQISNYLDVEAPTITRTLTRLEEMGWVIRAEGEDKRERYVSLSPQAQAKFPEWLDAAIQLEKAALRDIPEEDLATFNRILQKMNDNLNNLQLAESESEQDSAIS
ncbi:MarR family winged helix-turn-helix transcriptional regulator [Brevibacillus centrosporus]|uniref:Transcriptional regulator, MarR family n=1 Tax=Brevibacillus centrosporus TaxID=54910 RepID=A0A1I3V1D1_9BACL|nr:MarR family transcriptional regulator [Brevibacillus centrosporus]MEC2127420.1 MarR family transcriptional regulator [Brevibacillus centrosporus]MED1952163.1 MarR family transcriptional regulator [Brevibacillus centrosporus]MED4907305.1 MarR family transcriptional regulator [Brevibacillus centrosporus]RNB67950.1 MarR family transcriptional regulator [Brevibacillus centrosporus]SFJ88749.1 transcriptional regulator, MarR family [Brevibacillus centrosporus]